MLEARESLQRIHEQFIVQGFVNGDESGNAKNMLRTLQDTAYPPKPTDLRQQRRAFFAHLMNSPVPVEIIERQSPPKA